MFQVIFLGTAGSLPTPNRNPSAIILDREGEMILFDCGEGTQRQMMKARTGMMRLNHIFLTHLHADHILGIPGLLETMAFQGRDTPLVIAGPRRTVSLVRLFSALGCSRRSFEIRALDMKPGDKVLMNGFRVEAFATDHSIPSLGFSLVEDQRPGRFNRHKAMELGVPIGPLFGRLQRGETINLGGMEVKPEQVLGPPRPGRKVVYTGDSRPCQATEEASRGADLLIHDGALADDLADWALQTRHSTSGEAASLARRAGVLRLALTHISSRYSEDVSPLLADAIKIFPNTFVAEDLMRVVIPLRDK